MTKEEIRAIEDELHALNGGRWSNLYLEQQDNGLFLLVSMEMVASADIRLMEAVKGDVRKVLKLRIPRRPDAYSWMAVIKVDGRVVESTMGGSSGVLPEI